MGQPIRLTAEDGHACDAWRADPAGKPRAGLVVIQEVFGVNEHMRRVCEGFAGEGYTAIAPALFDRVERNVELGYGPDDIARGRELRGALGWDDPLKDILAAVRMLESVGPVGAVGYCWGGSLAWLAATRLTIAGAVCYYGAQIAQFLNEQPGCPVLIHLGEKDHLIPPEDVRKIRAAHPDVPVYMYPAGHGFNCEARADHDAESAALARGRTLAFLKEHLD